MLKGDIKTTEVFFICTAVSFSLWGRHYFGRNLDLDFSYDEQVTITPRNYPFSFRQMPPLSTHYAMIGMAFVQENYPLYYDAVNEKGLAAAGLMFSENAVYRPFDPTRDNIAPFELIPWVLGQCATTAEARSLLSRCSLLAEDFNPTLPRTRLHWIFADGKENVAAEPTAEGLRLYDNPFGVLTNEPPFPFHRDNLSLYRGLSAEEKENRFSRELPLFTRGSGGIGLPGDMTSPSRFVRAAFLREYLLTDDSEDSCVNGLFRILDGTAPPRGIVRTAEGKCHYTIYSSCCSAEKGIYYYKTYENSCISAVELFREELDGQELIAYPLRQRSALWRQN